MDYTEVRKLPPTGQIQTAICFSTAQELRMVFTFLKSCLKKKKKKKTRIRDHDPQSLEYLLSGPLQGFANL